MWKKDSLKKIKLFRFIISMFRIIYFFPYKIRAGQLNLDIRGPIETVKQLQKGKSIARFGDGEINLMLRKKSIGFQDYSSKLEKDLKEVLLNKENSYEIGLPYSFKTTNLDRFMVESFWWSYFCRNYTGIKENFSGKNFTFLDTNFSRVITEIKNKKDINCIIEEVRKVWEGKDVVIIEGNETRFGVGNDLLKSAKSVQRIIAPNKNAFDSIDKIYDVSVSNIKRDKKTLVLISLGPTATILISKLSNYYQCIDIGHFDLQYEYLRKGRYSSIKIPYKYDNEMLHGNRVADINDKEYKSQIIYKIF